MEIKAENKTIDIELSSNKFKIKKYRNKVKIKEII
jgi:hypothetical protein